MKDLTITGKRIQSEIKILIGCFILAVILNIYAIIKYNSGWGELFTQLHIEVLLSIVIYFVTGVIRIVIISIKRIIKK